MAVFSSSRTVVFPQHNALCSLLGMKMPRWETASTVPSLPCFHSASCCQIVESGAELNVGGLIFALISCKVTRVYSFILTPTGYFTYLVCGRRYIRCGQCGLPPCPPILRHRGASPSAHSGVFQTNNRRLFCSASGKLVDWQRLLLLQRPAAAYRQLQSVHFFFVFYVV